jgi:bifunctional DNA-binding transcriptional regulator/antitoxin component of YhaV-PrlF toxin-antitoxin module
MKAGVVKMDILHLVDRLEELFNESRPVPFTHSVVVDEDRLLDLIDQMRITIPEEIKKAQQLLAQKDRIMAQAREEGDRTIALAREKSEKLVEKDSVTQAAQLRAEQLIAQAKSDCAQTKREADEYVLHTLTNLAGELEQTLAEVKNGVLALRVEKQKSEPQPQPQVQSQSQP